VREKKFLATEDLSTKIKTNPSTITIREKFQFEEFDKVFRRVLLKLDNEYFIFISQRYGLVRYARRLLQKTPFPKGQSGPDMRVVEYINDITLYMETYHRYGIRTRALTCFHIVKNVPSLQSVEPLRKSAMLVFLASKEFGVSNVKNFLYEATGVSNSYLSKLDIRIYTDLIYKNQGRTPLSLRD
jgi:hypothetical protein